MTVVFVDAAYWIAVFRGDDQWSVAARHAMERLGDPDLVTTEEVLTEFLTALSRHGGGLRARAVQAVRMIRSDANVKVLNQSHDSFLDGLARYEGRLDKGYSLQDCISMNVMESEGITQVLTSDHNFEQEGFTVLMKPDA